MHISRSLSRLSRSSRFEATLKNEPSPPRPLSRSYLFRNSLLSEPNKGDERLSDVPVGILQTHVIEWMDIDDDFYVRLDQL